MSLDWKQPEFPPPYGVEVLIWIACDKCRDGESHAHICIYSLCNRPESFSIGSYCKGCSERDRKHLPPSMHVDYWSPIRPYAWAYVTPPEGRGVKSKAPGTST